MELREIMGATDDPVAIARGLVALAVLRGGPDNATVVTVVIEMP
jgi:serine/threonine protein phosphatase PrpC